MNSYDDNLRESLSQSLAALADQQAALLHGQSLAETDLYHAKGAVLATRDRLEADQRHRDERRSVHQAAQRAYDQSTALRGTLALAKDGSDGAITNTATTAKNLQASADAVMQLAATIGAAMNVASAALYDTELYHQIARVNANLNRVANQARFLALKGTEVSSKCAESIVGALADQGAGVQARLGDLLAQTQADLDGKVAAVNNDETALRASLAEEFTAHNLLREAQARQETMSAMLIGARRTANLDLQVEVASAKQIKLRFSPFQAPVAAGDHAAAPAPHPRNFLAIVPQNLAVQFSTDRAAQLFSKWDGHSGSFTGVQPGESSVTLALDVYGNPVSSDSAYVAFLYIEPSIDYKRYLGNFADYLSIASAPFTPLTALPAPHYAGQGATADQLLLAVADEGQIGSAPSTVLPALEAGAGKLDPLASWLQANGASLDPELALGLDAVVPPFVQLVKADLAAVKEGRPGTGVAAGRDLLKRLASWPEPEVPLTELTALRQLLPELLTLLEQAAAPVRRPAGAVQRLELRCILLDHAIDASLSDPEHKGKLPAYFTLETAQRVAPANYSLAKPLEKAPDGVKVPAGLGQKPVLWYAVDLSPEDKDCFGNPLLPGHRYAPLILATLRSTEPSGWQDRLTILDHVWHRA
ncbi:MULTISPECIES: hypothetical protein [unclassified Azospirillum]|uniref:hypothetical protein n=1 Tax=unclassified Azospirillum TaxID=2630922 RepID=UPI000B65CAF4|nr:MULTISPECIES: hypothetical protein [unclassified Azospirillum]SNS81296.1 hypothetical protein SAMN05880556_11285 [Azospirillum sp. RU38E]SNS98390.1 hypothetical protein SAMN05880591_11285 [Azospirillum sp. RU37A]